jgi:hypothetical protein
VDSAHAGAGTPELPSSALLRRVTAVEGAGFVLLLLLLSADDVVALAAGRPVSAWGWIEIAAGGAMAGVTLVLTRRLMQRIRLLEGLVSICMHCKRIRSGEQWTRLEVFIAEHSAATFTHGLCPDCYEREYERVPEG